MSKGILTSLAILFLGLGVASAQTPGAVLPADPMVGEWKLNLEKSKYVTPAPKAMTITLAPAARGYVFSVDAIGPDGQPQKWGFTSAFDGSESRVTGFPNVDSVVASTGTVRYKKAGVVITTTTSSLSDDGKTLTVTVKIPDGKGNEFTNVAVYERLR